jgi:hypothetical protein
VLTTYGAALCFVLFSVVCGLGVAALTGQRGWWGAGPAAGLAVLLCVGALASRLPGRELLGPLLLGLVILAAAVVALRGRAAWPPWTALATGALAFAVAALPFYVSGRAGLLGVSVNNDTSIHLVWAEALRSDRMAALYPLPDGYPLAPHALMAALASATGIAMDHVLNGLLIAAAALTALSALSLLARLPAVARVPGAALVGFAYLPAAYFGQGAFKETLMAMFLVAFTALLAEARAAPPARPWLAAGVPAGLLVAGAVQVYSYLALGWFVAIVAVWLVIELALGGRADVRGRVRAGAAGLKWPFVAAGAAVVVALAAQADRVLSFARLFGLSPAGATGGISAGDVGNLAGPLSPFEGLGLWPAADFRFAPANAFHAGELGAVAVAVLLIAAAAALRRREAPLVAAACAAFAIFWIADRGQSPYVAAKALALAAPLVMALALGAFPERGRWSEVRVARLALVAVFAVFAAYSTSLALRGSAVGSVAQERELAALRPLVGKQPTLFLGNDDHVAWWLRGVELGSPQLTSVRSTIVVPVRPQKTPLANQPFDFDSIDAPTLDRFAFVIVPRSGYASAPPPNFTRVRSGRLYELWARHGRTEPRSTVERSGAPGATLDCARVGRRDGVASVWMPAPAVSQGAPQIAPGAAADFSLTLTPGRWLVSLQYTSTAPLRIVSRLGSWRLPANTARPGPYFEVGRIDVPTSGPVGLRVIAEQAARVGSRAAGAIVSAVAATRTGAVQERPLRRSCNRYVDWYRAAGG